MLIVHVSQWETPSACLRFFNHMDPRLYVCVCFCVCVYVFACHFIGGLYSAYQIHPGRVQWLLQPHLLGKSCLSGLAQPPVRWLQMTHLQAVCIVSWPNPAECNTAKLEKTEEGYMTHYDSKMVCLVKYSWAHLRCLSSSGGGSLIPVSFIAFPHDWQNLPTEISSLCRTVHSPMHNCGMTNVCPRSCLQSRAERLCKVKSSVHVKNKAMIGAGNLEIGFGSPRSNSSFSYTAVLQTQLNGLLTEWRRFSLCQSKIKRSFDVFFPSNFIHS